MTLHIEDARCELAVYGFGAPDMLVEPPRFSWKLRGMAGMQQAYQIVVADSAAAAQGGEGSAWDSGWVQSPCSAQIAYAGAALTGDRDYFAAVRVRADNGRESAWSPAVRYSTGLLDPGEWVAGWLIAAEPSPVLPMFRREFSLRQGVRRARLFICGLGYYEAYLNGRRIGDRLLDPAWTDYHKRVCYVAYNVTDMLQTENALGVMLGLGWYANHELCPRPVFSAQVAVEYDDGTAAVFRTGPGEGWRSFSDGPMRTATLYIGEVYDARKELPGWTLPGYAADERWKPALEGEPPAGALAPMDAEPIRAVGELPAQSVTPVDDGFIVDFGQNLAGVVELGLSSPAGAEVTIRYAELLWKDGTLNTLNLRAAQQQDVYICRGGGESYRSRFTYHGFRYAEVRGVEALAPGDIKAVIIRNDVMPAGRFETSCDLLNRIQQICVWTESSNLHSVPTDCPQRDERLGWLNDLTVRAEEALCNFDMSRFYRKFLTDIADAQGPVTGAIPDTVPYNRYGGKPADAVCSSYLVLPWLLWQHYGDTQVLGQHYQGLAAWTEFLARQRQDGVVTYSYYGDWAAPIGGNVVDSVGSGAVSKITPGPLMSTGFLYMNAHLLEQIAAQLGKDAQPWRQLKQESQQALNRVFLNREAGYYAANSQAANTFMLYLGVVPDAYRQPVLQNLVADIRAHGTHTTTGNLCSRYIYDVLAQNGCIDLAYELLMQQTYPSWGYMLANGATTTWERWEYVEDGPLIGMASHNHPMYSTISGWFYTHLLGLRPTRPGFAEFAFRPYLPQKLARAAGSLETVKGTVEAAWEQSDTEIRMQLTVPFNAVCTLTLPGGMDVQLNGVKTEPQLVGCEAHLRLPTGSYCIVNRK